MTGRTAGRLRHNGPIQETGMTCLGGLRLANVHQTPDFCRSEVPT